MGASRTIWPWPSVLLERVANWMAALPGDRWLDAACGDGPLAELVGARKRLVGLDIDLRSARLAGKRPFALTVQASVTHLPLPEQSLDGIVSIETLEHVRDFDIALHEFARCIKPGGHLLLTMPSVTVRSWRQMRRERKPIYCCEEQHVRELSAITVRAFPNRFCTHRWLSTRLFNAGFNVLRSSGVGYLYPMWSRRLSFFEHGMNLLYRERVNRLFSVIPLLNRFAYYRLVLACRELSTSRAGGCGLRVSEGKG